MPYEDVDRANVEQMVREFYSDVLQDDILGPIFVKALGDDLKNGKWHEHLNTLYNFWMQMMTGESQYKGHPFPPHAFLGPLQRETFERWLELFHKTVHRLFVPEVANLFYRKADILAEQFMDNLGINDEDDEEWD